MDALYLLCVRIHAPVHLLTYLHIWLCAYKSVSISETVEDGMYKLGHGLLIAAKMYDLE